MFFEICVDSVNSAVKAAEAGAQRIELCSALSEGGVTPSTSLIKYCVQELGINTQVLVRPRGGDFLYNHHEFQVMCHDVMLCKLIGASGVVVGFLNEDGSVDLEKLKEIVDLAEDMDVVFHRAFDMCNDWELALETIIAAGCKRILTSGTYNTALEGKEMLKKIVEKAAGRIEILVGSGVNEENWEEIAQHTGCAQMHLSAKVPVASKMQFRNPNVSMGKSGHDEYACFEASSETLKKIL